MLPLAGCGVTKKSKSAGAFTGEKKAVATVIDDLANAGKARDAKKICDSVLARELVARLVDCQKAIKDQLKDADTFGLTATSVTIAGTTATAKVKSQFGGNDRIEALRFVKQGPVWRVAGFG